MPCDHDVDDFNDAEGNGKDPTDAGQGLRCCSSTHANWVKSFNKGV